MFVVQPLSASASLVGAVETNGIASQVCIMSQSPSGVFTFFMYVWWLGIDLEVGHVGFLSLGVPAVQRNVVCQRAS